jgi:hypothetical protein
MISRPSRAVSVGVLTCVLVLTGCSTGSPGSPTGSGSGSSSPADTTSGTSTSTSEVVGDEVKGRSGGFTVVPPEGWAEATDRANGVANIDLVLLSSKKTENFANNLVVVSVDGDQSVLEDELAKGKKQMSAAGRTVSEAPGRTVAGVPAVGFTTAFDQQGTAVLARSYGVQRAGKIYLLTLSSSQTDASHAMAEFDELLSTWAWT